MKTLEKLIKLYLLALVNSLILYCLFIFVTYQPSPFYWGVSLRFLFIGLLLLFTGFTVRAINE